MDRLTLHPEDVERGPAPYPPMVVDAEAAGDYHLTLLFETGEVRLFDVRPYLDRGPVFEPLWDEKVFGDVWVDAAGGVEWQTGAGFGPETLFAESTPGPAEETQAQLVRRIELLRAQVNDLAVAWETHTKAPSAFLLAAQACLEQAARLSERAKMVS